MQGMVDNIKQLILNFEFLYIAHAIIIHTICVIFYDANNNWL